MTNKRALLFDGRPRNSQGFQIGRSWGNFARTPDVAVVISLNRFLAPVDDTVTAPLCSTSTSTSTEREEQGKPSKDAHVAVVISIELVFGPCG